MNFLSTLLREHLSELIAIVAGLFTAIIGYMTVGKHKRKTEIEKIEIESENIIREQLLKVNTELSKAFDLHLEASKKHHSERLENIRLKSIIESIQENCEKNCLTQLHHAFVLANEKYKEKNEG